MTNTFSVLKGKEKRSKYKGSPFSSFWISSFPYTAFGMGDLKTIHTHDICEPTVLYVNSFIHQWPRRLIPHYSGTQTKCLNVPHEF